MEQCAGIIAPDKGLASHLGCDTHETDLISGNTVKNRPILLAIAY
jgi:hypothetical protein